MTISFLNQKKTSLVLAVIILLTSTLGVFAYQRSQTVSTDDAAIDGQAIILSPKVQGYIRHVYVEDNQQVHAGDVIMEIDPTDYQTKLTGAQMALAAAQAGLDAAIHQKQETAISAPAKAVAAREQMNAAQAAWKKALLDKQRMSILAENGACAQKELDQAIANESQTRATADQYAAELDAAKAAPEKIAASQSTAAQWKAKVEEAETAVEQAQNDLQHTKIIAPTDGRITKRSVAIGSYVEPGTQLCSLVSNELWVTANFKENQISKIQPGCQVKLAVDAYPELELAGVVDSIQAGTGSYFSVFPAENATGNFVKITQRIPVKIKLNSLPLSVVTLLGPGMSVVPTVYVKSVRHDS